MLLPGLLKQKISDTMDLKEVTFGSLPDPQTLKPCALGLLTLYPCIIVTMPLQALWPSQHHEHTRLLRFDQQSLVSQGPHLS